MAKARDFKFCTLVRHVAVQHWDYKLSLEWMWSQSRDVFNFWEMSDNNSKMVQNKRIVSTEVE